jgi:hypothetical protein
MNDTADTLKKFFDTFLHLGFFQRLFGWKHVRSLSYDAYQQYRSMVGELAERARVAEQDRRSIDRLNQEVAHLHDRHAALEKELRSTIQEQTFEIRRLNEHAERMNRDRSQLERELAALKESDAGRRADYEKRALTLDTIQRRTSEERRIELEERQRREEERLRQMKEQWSRHQEEVRTTIRMICQRHTIEYVDSVPFKGTPDNTVCIAGEYVVFDAKSPASDDLRHFPAYIKSQADSVRKYAREEGVRKEIFLVIPQSTAPVIEQSCYNMAEYSVYVVTPNALEPIILSLKRLEEYEFVSQLSPEERDNLCRLIGKFVHVAKRRIQVDHFFAWEFLDVLTRSEAYLPHDMLEKVVEFERSEKLNPPQERRSKQILTKELESDTERIRKEAEAKDITFPPSLKAELRSLPLFQQDSTEEP